MAQLLSAAAETKESNKLQAEAAQLVVMQPQKLESLMGTIDLIDRISERIGEDHSGDWSGSGGTTGQQGDDDDQTSPRAQAIASIPNQKIMLTKIEKEIKKEATHIESEIKNIKRLQKAGSAWKINKLYAKLRQFYSLLDELAAASYDIVKRLYIRVFIDNQPILQ